MGGELFSVLREKTLFDEDTARFFAASVVLAFEYMHTLNIIYRGQLSRAQELCAGTFPSLSLLVFRAHRFVALLSRSSFFSSPQI